MKSIRKKNSRQRGSSSHGWGAKKKHRGAGHRGGRGRAGSGKRGDSTKPSYWKDKKENYGKSGFKSKSRTNVKAINVCVIETKLETYIKLGKVELKNDVYFIDLNLLKKNKLLGTGKITKKMEIKAEIATKSAIKKVEAAGGKVILPQKETVKEKVKVEVKNPEAVKE
jgi:large subunit ribosomal protein L15